MLKVIDEFDLKGLEQFGFHKEFDYYEGYDIIVDCYSREIEIYEGGEEKLFDLIQAGIVEKVEEQGE